MNEEMKEYTTKYPRQIARDIKELQNLGYTTFVVDALFDFKVEKLPENPMELYPESSVFNLTIIQGGKSFSSNIKYKEIAPLVKKTEIIYELAFTDEIQTKCYKNARMLTKQINEIYERTASTNDGQNNSAIVESGTQSHLNELVNIAYKNKFVWGAFIGTTPGEVLKANPEKKDEVLNVRNLLSKNLNKFPKNKNLIDSIDAAIQLLTSGYWNANERDSTFSAHSETDDTLNSAILNEPTWKFKTKNTNEKVVNGKKYYRCHRLTLMYNPNMRLPIIIRIETCFAPIEKDKKNPELMNILIKDALDKSYVKKQNYLSLDEWLNVVDVMKEFKRRFGDMVFPHMYNLSMKCEKFNREQALKKGSF